MINNDEDFDPIFVFNKSCNLHKISYNMTASYVEAWFLLLGGGGLLDFWNASAGDPSHSSPASLVRLFQPLINIKVNQLLASVHTSCFDDQNSNLHMIMLSKNTFSMPRNVDLKLQFVT